MFEKKTTTTKMIFIYYIQKVSLYNIYLLKTKKKTKKTNMFFKKKDIPHT